LEYILWGGVGVFKPFWNIYYAGAGVAFNKSDMLVPPTSVDVVSSDTGCDSDADADAADAVGGAVTTGTGTDILGIICTFFATSLLTFWF
jgi:hypothetical protein